MARVRKRRLGARPRRSARAGRSYLCFHCQQAAEKALKALLLDWSIPFPYIHDLVRLMGILDGNSTDVPQSIRDAAGLTEYAVAARYPGFDEPISEDELAEAIALAERVLTWVAEQLPGNERDGSGADTAPRQEREAGADRGCQDS